jgi:hypothetical protein
VAKARRTLGDYREPQFLEELSQAFYKRVDALGLVPEEDLPALQLAFMQAHRADRVLAEPSAGSRPGEPASS